MWPLLENLSASQKEDAFKTVSQIYEINANYTKDKIDQHLQIFLELLKGIPPEEKNKFITSSIELLKNQPYESNLQSWSALSYVDPKNRVEAFDIIKKTTSPSLNASLTKLFANKDVRKGSSDHLLTILNDSTHAKKALDLAQLIVDTPKNFCIQNSLEDQVYLKALHVLFLKEPATQNLWPFVEKYNPKKIKQIYDSVTTCIETSSKFNEESLEKNFKLFEKLGDLLEQAPPEKKEELIALLTHSLNSYSYKDNYEIWNTLSYLDPDKRIEALKYIETTKKMSLVELFANENIREGASDYLLNLLDKSTNNIDLATHIGNTPQNFYSEGRDNQVYLKALHVLYSNHPATQALWPFLEGCNPPTLMHFYNSVIYSITPNLRLTGTQIAQKFKSLVYLLVQAHPEEKERLIVQLTDSLKNSSYKHNSAIWDTLYYIDPDKRIEAFEYIEKTQNPSLTALFANETIREDSRDHLLTLLNKPTDKVNLAEYIVNNPDNFEIKDKQVYQKALHVLYSKHPATKLIWTVVENYSPREIKQIYDYMTKLENCSDVEESKLKSDFEDLKHFLEIISDEQGKDHVLPLIKSLSNYPYHVNSDFWKAVSDKSLSSGDALALFKTTSANYEIESITSTKPEGEPLKDIPKIDIQELTKLFKKINFTNPNKPYYIDPSKLKEDGKPISINQLIGGMKNLISYIKNKKPHIGVPGGDKKDKWYQELEITLKNVIFTMKNSKDTTLVSKELINLSIAGFHCGSRWKADIHDAYRSLNEDLINYEKGENIEEKISNFMDIHKEEIFNAIYQNFRPLVSKGLEPHLQNLIAKTLTDNGFKLPPSIMAKLDFDDRLMPTHISKDDILNSFKKVSSPFHLLNKFKSFIDQRVENNPKLLGPLFDILKAYVEKSLLEKYPDKAAEIKQKETDLINSKADDIPSRLLGMKNLIFEDILEQENLIAYDDSYTPSSVTNSGLIGLLKYFGYLEETIDNPS